MSVLQSLKDATSVKEKEWRELLEMSIEKLESELEQTKKALEEEQTRFLELKTDFKHNYALFQDKESKCNGLQMKFEQMKEANENLKNDYNDISETNEKLRSQIDYERTSIEEIRVFFKDSIDRQSKEHERTRKELEKYYTEEIEVLQKTKTSLMKDLALLEENFNSQKDQYIAEHEEKFFELRTENDEKFSSMEQKIFTLELEKDMLFKDMQTLTAAANSLQRELEEKDGSSNELKTSKKTLELKLKDLQKVHQAHIKQSQYELAEMNEKFSKQANNSEFKISNLKDTLSKSEMACKELKIETNSLKQQVNDQKRSQLSEMQIKDEEVSRLKSRFESDLMQKDSSHEKLFDEKRKLQQELELCTIEKDRLAKMLNEEGKHCQEKLDRMKYDLKVKNEDLERYRGEIAVNLENIRALQQEMEQKDLDWSRKCEQIEASSYEKSEALVKTLSEHRSKMSVEISELKRAVNAKTHLVHLLKKERDCSVLTLRRHNLSVDFDIPIKDSQVDLDGLKSIEFERMTDQNENLREVIKKMREEMVNFSKETDTKHRREVQKLTNRITDLQREVDEKSSKLQQIQSSNRTFETELNKLRSKIESQSTDENVDNSIATEKFSDMQYELMTQKRKSASEIKSLKSQLELAEEKIEKLNHEKESLFHRLRTGQQNSTSFGQSMKNHEAEYIVQLNNKLKTAAKHINYLAKERQRLIAACNKLRAGSLDAPTKSPEAQKGVFKSRLDEIQQLQYELARKQLAENFEGETGGAGSFNQISVDDESNERPKRIDSPILSSSRGTSPSQTLARMQSNVRRNIGPEMHSSSSAVESEPTPDRRRKVDQGAVDVMSSIGAEDTTLQNIMKMVDKGPESFTPMMASLNSSDGTMLNRFASGNQISEAQEHQRVTEGNHTPGSKPGQNLEVVGKSESIAAEKDRKQVTMSLKAQGKLAAAETRKRVVRNYNNKSEE